MKIGSPRMLRTGSERLVCWRDTGPMRFNAKDVVTELATICGPPSSRTKTAELLGSKHGPSVQRCLHCPGLHLAHDQFHRFELAKHHALEHEPSS